MLLALLLFHAAVFFVVFCGALAETGGDVSEALFWGIFVAFFIIPQAYSLLTTGRGLDFYV